jgi:hypothetical protein
MDDAGIPALLDAIRHLHGCDANHLETVPLRETMPDGRVVWEGDVEVFGLVGHPIARRCYAWSHVTTGTKRQFYAVLHAGPVDSPLRAVQAVIVQMVRKAEN